MQTMQFKEGTDVLTVGGDKVGNIDRVVINPQSNEVTHIVVRKGFLLPEDKVVPVGAFTSATEQQATLRPDITDLDDLPPFEEQHYIPWDTEPSAAVPPGTARPYAWYPPAGSAWWGYPGYAGYYGYAPYVTPVMVERNIPEGTIPLESGAKVISADGEHVGDVERVFVDEATDRISHFVISEGLIFKTKKLVPTSWVVEVDEGEVYLAVTADRLDRLAEFNP